MTEELGSVSGWLEGLRVGNAAAEQQLWDRYFEQLVRLARARLNYIARDTDGEDVALSAMKSVMIGIRENRFPDLADRSGLWPLLVDITVKKAISEQRRQLAVKRARSSELQLSEVEQYLGKTPNEQTAVDLLNQLNFLFEAIGDTMLNKIVELKLSCYTNDEIAQKLNCSERTVRRKIDRIRLEWKVASSASNDL
jgi:DNA-directed RNA polymerase specialized sigma24 family protein